MCGDVLWYPVTLIFDSGSQRSYITNKLKEVLSLRPRHTESMIIKTFGYSKGEKQLCDVISIGLYMKDGSVEELFLLPVPSICESLPYQHVTYASRTFEYFSHLDLTDHCSEEDTLELDIMIGCDHFSRTSIIRNSIIRISIIRTLDYPNSSGDCSNRVFCQ